MTVTASDVRQYLAADALFRAVDGHDPMPFWKSAPYLAHFMHGYKFNELFDEAMSTPAQMVDALQRHDLAFLKAATLRSWGSIDPGHAKLRELVGELIDEGLWRLLWMPPTMPYWPLEGPFEGQGTSDEAPVVLRLERGAGRRQRRPELRSGTADDGRPARLLRKARRTAEATAETDTVNVRRSVPTSSPPAAPALPATGGPRASAGRAGRRGPPGLGASPSGRASGGPRASEPAGREHRRPVGMGGAALAGSGICRPSCVRGVTASFTRGRTASLCRSPIRRSSVSTSTIYSRSTRELSAGVLQISRTCSPTSPSARRPFSRHAV